MVGWDPYRPFLAYFVLVVVVFDLDHIRLQVKHDSSAVR